MHLGTGSCRFASGFRDLRAPSLNPLSNLQEPVQPSTARVTPPHPPKGWGEGGVPEREQREREREKEREREREQGREKGGYLCIYIYG